ncbi:MAG: hypothetical protein HZB47_14130 [Nitrosomonadales bacterium]|nr:hypothetical protein [Nitrosomonadales bacterium]
MNKIITGFIMAAVVAVLLAGCIGSGGSSASPPNDVTVVAKDSRAVLTWTMAPGVDYWIFRAAGSGVTPENCSSMAECGTSVKATSPATVWGLSNGKSYSFSINGRSGGGPGGAGSVAEYATPGLAGKTWNVGTAAGTSDLRGVAYGASGTKFVAVGMGGALFSGTVSTSASTGMGEVAWTSMTNPVTGTDFNAVNYDTYRAKFYSVGTGGVVIQNIPASSTEWTQLTSTNNTTEALYAIASDGAGNLVATGASGRIIYSSDGTAWTKIAFGTSALYGVAYGNSTTNGYVFVAVGAGGKILWSDDKGATWTDVTAASVTSEDLKAVTYGGINSASSSTTSVGVFVAVGANGTVLTSVDGVTWTRQTGTSIPSTTNLNGIALSASKRFVAVADDGNVFYSGFSVTNAESATGMVWSSATQATTSPLYAVTTGGLNDYCSVGNGGSNLYADLAD